MVSRPSPNHLLLALLPCQILSLARSSRWCNNASPRGWYGFAVRLCGPPTAAYDPLLVFHSAVEGSKVDCTTLHPAQELIHTFITIRVLLPVNEAPLRPFDVGDFFLRLSAQRFLASKRCSRAWCRARLPEIGL
ncbi:hypothetical protein FNV43_RR08485 [Rhamnella rubrinervis]|uniref:Secreted protein n=1 Tax=Rhamnella rubrinervis TaxID=2594499 RepID=A0A8K0H8A6_9ROSA|nr:hypothetical protein FNV43_RR08485 [Rhamnella rubrinervis]